MIPKIETAQPHQIKAFQELELAKLLDYVSRNSPFYKKLFSEHQIDISRVKTLEDLHQLPLTT